MSRWGPRGGGQQPETKPLDLASLFCWQSFSKAGLFRSHSVNIKLLTCLKAGQQCIPLFNGILRVSRYIEDRRLKVWFGRERGADLGIPT